MTGFQALSAALQHAASQAGYDHPTPIQALTLPAVLAGRDVLALAETGSGKTAAYALPLLQRLLEPSPTPDPRVLVLVPTRELALQVAETFRALAGPLPRRIKVAALFGGVSINPQLMGLRGGADAIVATPGRLLDVIQHNGVHLQAVQTLVLDEGDRLLSAGFEEEWHAIARMLPPQRQNLVVSATLPTSLEQLTSALLKDPVRLELEALPSLLTQRAIQVDAAQRGPLLRHLIRSASWPRTLVFVATRYAADHVADKLNQHGLAAAALHGDQSQGARRDVLSALKKGQLQVLVCTDLAARGVHIPDLAAVINHDLPRSAADHLHRIGRTGRMGQAGVAVSFICADSPTNAESHFRLIEKRQGQRIAREQVAGFEPQSLASEQQATGGIKGKRPNKKDKARAALKAGQS
ncbi:DEAD/DEAH box helicase [Inhella gelatinilytica]|uniref:DEAD/DEAH box helicase n=1 Tax=Inhella gelatinilytica TaxID=2795030 RepID=A0A931ISM5_9BURK|nr:DEAD/DEAH box helicase [Inhella gelatinilytica]MBH9551950.1 DEAD/DEAH box helicase [Inhella gelatinilytica]